MPVSLTAATPAPLRILFVTPEATPFAKTGGLADVAGALPRELAKRGYFRAEICHFHLARQDAGYRKPPVELPTHLADSYAGEYEGQPRVGVDTRLLSQKRNAGAEGDGTDFRRGIELREQWQGALTTLERHRVVVNDMDRQEIGHGFYAGAGQLAGIAEITLDQCIAFMMGQF